MRHVVPIAASEIIVDDAHYVRGTLSQIWEELPILLAGAILLTLVAAPVLWLAANGLMPLAVALGVFLGAPLYASVCHVAGRNAIGNTPRLSDGWSALVHFYIRSSLLVLPLAALLTASSMTMPLLQLGVPILVIASTTLQAILTFGVCLLTIHAFPLLALFDLPLRQVWPYSLVLVVRWPLVAIGLLSMFVLLVFAASAAGPGAWPVLPVVFVPFSVNATLMLTKRVKEVERTVESRR